jgi:hypothetical protein
MNPNELNIVKPDGQIDEQAVTEVAETLNDEYRANQAVYDRFSENRENAVVTPANVRRASLWVIGSIKTDTNLVDSGASGLLSGDFSKDKAFLEGTTDGELKWDRYGEWFSSQIPDRVAELLESGRVDDAHALLAGRDPDTGEWVGDYYLRANKASLVLYLLGFDKVCMDTRIYRATKPVMWATLDNDAVRHPETELDNPYRNRSPGMDAKHVLVISHSGDDDWDGEKSYWEDKLKWNVPQYDALTGHLIDLLAERSDVPRELIPQVAFNTEGNTTGHETLMERIQ